MRTLKLISSVTICFLVAGIGSAITLPSLSNWYEKLSKPSFNPPNWVFGPVWTVLFLLIGIALFLVLDQKKRGSLFQMALFVFFLQLFLNLLWSTVFFGFHSIFGAFIVILLLWISILFTILLFKKFSSSASYLLIPYILWVSFASVLNFFILLLN